MLKTNMFRVGQIKIPGKGKFGVYRKKGLGYQATEIGFKED